jgi:sortase A
LKRKINILLLVFLLLGGGYFAYQAVKIDIKAKVSQILLYHSWNNSLERGVAVKPWESFDGSPILKLEIPNLEINQIVLNNTSGQSLAFGPGFHQETYLPHLNKTTAISSHRDSHGAFIKKLKIGDIIKLQDIKNNWYKYRVEDFFIINVHDEINLNQHNGLLLITCYPFDAITSGTSLRYIVISRKISQKAYP